MFRFNSIELYFHAEDIGKIFSIPYRGSYIELKEGKIDTGFYDKYLAGKVLHRKVISDLFVKMLKKKNMNEVFIGRTERWQFKWKLLSQSMVAKNVRPMAVGATFAALAECPLGLMYVIMQISHIAVSYKLDGFGHAPQPPSPMV